mmetsp:Transcript_36162/g.66708  ORF Transcript_36162/g.66708 Transcript_36162/m.66708 type:complete len:87 (-) Transcript_36162:651-911(-)
MQDVFLVATWGNSFHVADFVVEVEIALKPTAQGTVRKPLISEWKTSILSTHIGDVSLTEVGGVLTRLFEGQAKLLIDRLLPEDLLL